MGFMLAAPVETPDELFDKRDGLELPPLLVEEKYDGIRAQVHKNKRGEVRIFSRTLAEVTEFPELIVLISELLGELIIDGEILAWRDTRSLLFTELQWRLGSIRLYQFIMNDIL